MHTPPRILYYNNTDKYFTEKQKPEIERQMRATGADPVFAFNLDEFMKAAKKDSFDAVIFFSQAYPQEVANPNTMTGVHHAQFLWMDNRDLMRYPRIQDKIRALKQTAEDLDFSPKPENTNVPLFLVADRTNTLLPDVPITENPAFFGVKGVFFTEDIGTITRKVLVDLQQQIAKAR